MKSILDNLIKLIEVIPERHTSEGYKVILELKEVFSIEDPTLSFEESHFLSSILLKLIIAIEHINVTESIVELNKIRVDIERYMGGEYSC